MQRMHHFRSSNIPNREVASGSCYDIMAVDFCSLNAHAQPSIDVNMVKLWFHSLSALDEGSHMVARSSFHILVIC